jgi:uncharacterized peroxidase-related enzyme
MKEKRPVTALKLPEAQLDPENKDYFRVCEEKLGFTPNVLKAYAFDNKKLSAFIDLSDDLLLGDSGLSKLEREMIAVAVSAVNHCHYCLTAHGAAVRLRANDPMLGDTIEHNYRAAPLTPKQNAMLDFAVKLTEAPDKIESADARLFGSRLLGHRRRRRLLQHVEQAGERDRHGAERRILRHGENEECANALKPKPVAAPQ